MINIHGHYQSEAHKNEHKCPQSKMNKKGSSGQKLRECQYSKGSDRKKRQKRQLRRQA